MAQLGQWEQAWSGQSSAPSSGDNEDHYKASLERMRTAQGPEFDEAAGRALRVHARAGVMESASCQEQAMHEELKAFCSELNAAQTRVVANARRWICEWFNDCTEH